MWLSVSPSRDHAVSCLSRGHEGHEKGSWQNMDDRI